jgi:ATP-binding cassette subfamily B protein
MYHLNKNIKTNTFKSLKEIFGLIQNQRSKLLIGMFCVLVSSIVTILTPYILGIATDEIILKGLGSELLIISIVLIITYMLSSLVSYLQITIIGGIGIETLYNLRNRLFAKINELPVAFFNVNKSGDLISRINNDTDVLNGLFSEVLVRFFSSFFTIIGIGIFLIFLNPELGLISVGLTLSIVIYTIITSNIYIRINRKSQDAVGDLSAEIAENLSNYKVIIAFDKKEFFRNRIYKSVDNNFRKLTIASFVNGIATPIYDFVGNLAIVFVVVLGLGMVQTREISIGILISILLLVNRFYEPLRVIASLIGSIQRSASSWERINEILKLESNLKTIEQKFEVEHDDNILIKMIDVDFGYGDGLVLKDVDIDIKKGKTYALVGPTGGGKSTLASLIIRLFDPVYGKVLLKGFDIRSFKPEEVTSEISFILQEPFMIDGTVRDNLKYGNKEIENFSDEQLLLQINKLGLDDVLAKFSDGLDERTGSTSNLSLGQRQLVAFMRAILRKPKLLIMDEATANVDTVTEKLLEKIWNALPSETSKIIIAHRLNTIKKADEIFLIANGRVERAGNFESVVKKLSSKKIPEDKE